MLPFKFQNERNHAERAEESKRVAEKYPDKVPIICEMAPNGHLPRGVLNTDVKTKFLVNKNMTLGEFVGILRNRLKLPPETAIFIFINRRLPSLSSHIFTLQQNYMHSDGFLYMHYNFENVFGSN